MFYLLTPCVLKNTKILRILKPARAIETIVKIFDSSSFLREGEGDGVGGRGGASEYHSTAFLSLSILSFYKTENGIYIYI